MTHYFVRLSMLQLDDINLQVTALFMFRFFKTCYLIHLMITLCEIKNYTIITQGYRLVCIRIMLELIIVNIWLLIEELILGIIYQSH